MRLEFGLNREHGTRRYVALVSGYEKWGYSIPPAQSQTCNCGEVTRHQLFYHRLSQLPIAMGF